MSNLIYDENKNWQVGVAPSNDGFQQISFVNSVSTWVGGQHVDYIVNQIVNFLKEKISKKYKTEITPSQIKNHIFLFVNATVKNPKFSSQTKERCISPVSDFINPIKLTDKFLNQIYKSEITNLIADWLEQKKVADERAAERDANKSLKVKVDKLVDCSYAGGIHKAETSLAITEGDSAAAGFRKFRDAKKQALLPIRGKILNVRDTAKDKVLANVEIKSIMSAMGLQFGKSPFVYSDKEKIKIILNDTEIECDIDDTIEVNGVLYKVYDLLSGKSKIATSKCSVKVSDKIADKCSEKVSVKKKETPKKKITIQQENALF